MFTVEQVRVAMSMKRGSSNTQIKKECHRRRVHCRELAAAIKQKRAAQANTWPKGDFKSISLKEARNMGVHWVLWTIKDTMKLCC